MIRQEETNLDGIYIDRLLRDELFLLGILLDKGKNHPVETKFRNRTGSREESRYTPIQIVEEAQEIEAELKEHFVLLRAHCPEDFSRVVHMVLFDEPSSKGIVSACCFVRDRI